MGILSLNNADIKSVIEEWFEKNVTTNNKPIIVKKANGKFSHISVEGDIVIENFPEKELPFYVVFGKVNGDFKLSQCHQLSSVSGFPLEVTGNFICEGCEALNIDEIRYVEKDRVWNMKTVNTNDPKSLKGWLNYFESGRASERPLRKIDGKLIIR